MREYNQLTQTEKINASSEEITKAIILQCNLDGVPYPIKPELKELKPVKVRQGGIIKFMPVIATSDYGKEISINLFFDSAEEAIAFVEGKNFLVATEDYRIGSNLLIGSIKRVFTKTVRIYNSVAEYKNPEFDMVQSANVIISDENGEMEERYNDELKAYQEHSQQYFDDWKELLAKHHNTERLAAEWRNTLSMCEGHITIAERFFRSAHPDADLDTVKEAAKKEATSENIEPTNHEEGGEKYV